MSICLQIGVNVGIAACVYSLVGIGFALVLRTVQIFHFAHAIAFSAGGYFLYLFCQQMNLPLGVAIVCAVGISTIVGLLVEIIVYRPLRHRNASSLVLLLASLGTYVILQNLISLVFGDNAKSVRQVVAGEVIDAFGVRATILQVTIVCVAIGLLSVVSTVLNRTRMGIGVRAVGESPVLASISGVPTDRTILCVFAIASAIAAVAGAFVCLDGEMTPTVGMNYLMVGAVVAIISGGRGVWGILITAVLLTLVQHIAAWFLSIEWTDTVAFIVLIGFLFLKSVGCLGGQRREAIG